MRVGLTPPCDVHFPSGWYLLGVAVYMRTREKLVSRENGTNESLG